MTVPGTRAEGIEVRPAAPEDDERRDAFARERPEASFFHLAGWRRAVHRVFEHEERDLLAWRGDELVGVLPLMASPSFSNRIRLISAPFATYGGPVATDDEARRALVAEAVAMADREDVSYLELRSVDDPVAGAGIDLVPSDLYVTFVRELPESPGEVLDRMPKKSRAEARKARERHGLEVSEGIWYVDDLHRLFVANKHALGSPSLPARFFHELLQEFDDAVSVHLVRAGEEPLAAVMSFHWRETLIAYYSGTRPGADRRYSASNFMYMALQEWAVERGFRRFDFGRSRTDSGAFQFKCHQGFEPRPLEYRFHLVRSRRLPSFNPSNPRTAVLRNTWSKLPGWLVARLSNRLARYLP